MPRQTGAGTRATLLGAAERVVVRDGVGRLTLDAVAREAGASKGGILYHFPTKDALVGAMVARLCDGFERDIERRLAETAGAETAGGWARAFVRATFEPSEPMPADAIGFGAALLAAAATDPALLDPLRERYAAWQARLEADGIDPALATVIRLAADGLVLAELFGLAPPAPALRARVLATLERLTAEGER